LLATVSQISSENQEQNFKQKDLKNLKFCQKSLCKGSKEDTVSQEIAIIKSSQRLAPGPLERCLEGI
jgi:hypothetical protein